MAYKFTPRVARVSHGYDNIGATRGDGERWAWYRAKKGRGRGEG